MTIKSIKLVTFAGRDALPVIDTWPPPSLFDVMAEDVSKLINSRPRSPTRAEIAETLREADRRARHLLRATCPNSGISD